MHIYIRTVLRLHGSLFRTFLIRETSRLQSANELLSRLPWPCRLSPWYWFLWATFKHRAQLGLRLGLTDLFQKGYLLIFIGLCIFTYERSGFKAPLLRFVPYFSFEASSATHCLTVQSYFLSFPLASERVSCRITIFC